MRVLGIDFGQKRIGIAVSDATGTLARPLATLSRRAGRRPPLAALEQLAREHEVERLVAGLPLDLQGREDAWCAEVRSACDRLAERLEIPIQYVDERLTTVQAQRALREAGGSRAARRDRERIDSAAAAVILQSWLDGRRS